MLDYEGFRILKSEELSAAPGSFSFDNLASVSEGHVWQGVNTRPIPFSKETAKVVKTELDTAMRSTNPLTYIVDCRYDDSLRAEIKRFIIAVNAYYVSPNPVIPYKEILEGINDEFFAAYLKKVRSKSLILKSQGFHDMDPGDEFKHLPNYHIDDIGDVFNFKYWFNWLIEPGHDLDFHQVPVEYDVNSLALFKASVRKLVKEVKDSGFHVPEVTEESISDTLSSSSCMKGSKRSKVWKEKEISTDFSTRPLKGYVTYVQKGPEELREAITLSVGQSNSVRLIDKQVYHIVKNMRYSAYHADPEIFESRFGKFCGENLLFFNRDLTKEGITKPRVLVKTMLEVLQEEFPTFKAWKYKGIFDNLTIVFPDGTLKSTERGHGLGMANSLTTLMQCAAFDSFLESIDVDNTTMDALFFNDDASIGSSDRTNLETYQDGEADFLTSLGLIPKGSKTWTGRVCVLCEHYDPPTLNVKASYKNYARTIPFTASCILSAKSMCNLTLDPTYGEPRWDLFETLVQFFGTESGDTEEITTPYTAGGWINLKYGGVDTSFLDYQDGTPSLFLQTGAHIGAPRLKAPNFSKETGPYMSPLEKRYTIPPLPENVEKRMLIKRSRAEISALFSRNGDEFQQKQWLLSQIKQRKEMWRQKFPYLSWKEVFELVSNQDSSIDILPPRFLIKVVDDTTVSIPGSGRFETTDPALSVIRFYSKELPSSCHTVPWPVYDSRGGADVTGSKIQRSETKNLFLPKANHVFMVNPYMEDRILTNRCWKNSYNVWKVWVAITGNPTYPINPWPTGDAALHKEFEIYEAHIEKYWNMYKYTDRLGWKPILTLIRNPDFIDEILEGQEVLKEEEPPPAQEEGLDFSSWYFSGRDSSYKSPLMELWQIGAECIETTLESEANYGVFSSVPSFKYFSYQFRSEIEEELTLAICKLVKGFHTGGFITYHFREAIPPDSGSEDDFIDIFDCG